MIKELLFVAAAHSGGHITPAAQLAKQWQETHPEGRVVFFTSNRALDQKLCAANPWIDQVITLHLDHSMLPQPLGFLTTAWRLLSSFFVSLYYAYSLKPTAMISTGGMLGIPVSYAAWLTGAQITLHELNAIPGRASKVIAPLATSINICFQDTKKHFGFFAPKCYIVPYPLRFAPELSVAPADCAPHLLYQNKEMVCTHHLQTRRKTILILGGSQGSTELNQAVPQLLRQHPHLANKLNILHQTGNTDPHSVAQEYAALGVPACVFSYLDHIHYCYWLADLVLCRAGAGAIFESLFFGKKTLLLPLVHGADAHQVANAQAIAAMHPEQFKVTTLEILANDIETLLA